jgi:hypothetical protein
MENQPSPCAASAGPNATPYKILMFDLKGIYVCFIMALFVRCPVFGYQFLPWRHLTPVNRRSLPGR